MIKESKNDDLVVVEFLKEARLLKRQLQLIKNNIEYISLEDLVRILTISTVIEKEFNELRSNSQEVLEKHG